jgi:hypothetical protein
VRCDCPPSHLLDFLCSSAGLSANETAAQVAGSREEEEALLAEVRDALGAKHVIRVCSSYNQVRPRRLGVGVAVDGGAHKGFCCRGLATATSAARMFLRLAGWQRRPYTKAAATRTLHRTRC